MNTVESLAYFDDLPDAAYIRLPALTALFACSPATVWRRVRDGNIPKPKKLSKGVTAWKVGEIRKALLGVEAF